ncbi:MAG: hypothetical protein JWM72_1805 [Actinomycetia bacterium]|nr:hypothetical protein [Actinomycetes bacterium]
MSKSKAIRGFAAAVVAACAVGVPAAASARGEATRTAPITVDVTRVYTDTGLRLKADESVTIRAGGTIRFQDGKVASATPTGFPWGPRCTEIAGSASSVPWPAPGQRCWSLIGRIGSHAPFEIGAARTIRAGRGGELFLGINDNHVGDNRGAWTVTITRGAATSKPTDPARPTSPAVPAVGGSKSSSSIVPILVIVFGLIAVVLLLGWAIRRRTRSDDAEDPAQVVPRRVPVLVPEPVLEPAGVAVATAAASPPPVRDVFDPTTTDVNIFLVDVSEPGAVRVGYSFFPADTLVRWRVAANEAVIASGQFVTEGGGSAKHFVELPLQVQAPTTDGIDLQFHWNLGDVPFDYSVRRYLVG